MATKKPDEKTIAETFAAIEEKIEALESDDITLEDAFVRYREGMELVKSLDGAIDRIEKKVLQLSDDLKLSEFGEDADE